MRMTNDWPVVELRQYTLHPGQRDALIELFDREFVETQETAGMWVIGQFRDLDNPDRFVWMRAFRGMVERGTALTAFYVEGETWRIHGPAASATMVDSKNALLLRPAGHSPGFPSAERPPVGATEPPDSRVIATIYYRHTPVDAEFATFFEQQVAPVLAETGATPLAYFETEPAENTFPRLPVRSGEHVFVWFAAFAKQNQYRAHLDRLAESAVWTEKVLPELASRTTGPSQVLRLAPTARSQLRG